ncbi:ubiquinone biosynthesis protein COQ3, mitochondrial isoform X1 [Megachile rotundata]|uniref:ubiquinone biosynthesis protein COQ3, mitochondrial isoform X1 n=1 Tax=Megachile rotundata TaxID=143995 RepID=UPI000258EAD8|nr:PREDICTED: hexaprenyldihydroxybenzoate methyltransferase, mitochondrial isoform X1 [Megachile rotundata]
MRVVKLLSFRSISTKNTFQSRINEQIDQLAKPTTIIKKSTVDLATVDLHSKLSNKWWDIKGEMRALHALNPLRVQFVRDGLANTGINIESPHLPLEGIKILDVGCGGGLLSEPLARIGAEVTGIDASSELITVAKEHAALDSNISGRLNYIQTVIEDFAPTNSKVYNAVIASEVVEHVNEKELFLKCCVSTLKPDGSIFLTTLNKTLPSWLGGIIAAEYVLKLVPKGTHDWNKFISPAEMQRLLETYGCKTKLIHGMFYNPLKNEWSWVASRAINYAIHAVKRKE